jgi:hypothetical protein
MVTAMVALWIVVAFGCSGRRSSLTVLRPRRRAADVTSDHENAALVVDDEGGES